MTDVILKSTCGDRNRLERSSYKPRNTKDFQQPAEAGRGRKDFLLEPSEGSANALILFGLLASELRETICCLKPLFVVAVEEKDTVGKYPSSLVPQWATLGHVP